MHCMDLGSRECWSPVGALEPLSDVGTLKLDTHGASALALGRV